MAVAVVWLLAAVGLVVAAHRAIERERSARGSVATLCQRVQRAVAHLWHAARETLT
jgi:hypothetical protein